MHLTKYFFITLIFFIASTSANSKSLSCSSIKVGNKTPFIDAIPLIKEMVDQILTIGKIKGRYLTCIMPKSSNASANVYKGHRVIFYDPAFLGRLANKGEERYWGRVVILAHEIAHLIYKHPQMIKNNQRLPESKQIALQRGYELKADYFSGEILARMGASLASTIKVITLLKIHPDEKNSDHPQVRKRLKITSQGWQSGYNRIKKECSGVLMPDSTCPITSPLGRKVTSGYINFVKEAISLKGKYVNKSYCGLYTKLAMKQTKRSIRHNCKYGIAKSQKSVSSWSLFYSPQFKWCMKGSSRATYKEAAFRETKLASCIK